MVDIAGVWRVAILREGSGGGREEEGSDTGRGGTREEIEDLEENRKGIHKWKYSIF